MNNAHARPLLRGPGEAAEARNRTATARIVGQQTLGLAILAILSVSARAVSGSGDALLAANAAILIAFIAMSVWHAYDLVRSDAYNIWMPVTLYILSSALFIGFGPLAYNFGNEGTKTYLALRALNVGPTDLNRATTLSMIGLCGVNVGMLAIFASRSRAVVEAIKGQQDIVFSPQLLAGVFVIVGLLFKYCLVYPSKWGMISLTIPGIINEINALSALGFSLWAYFAFRRGGSAIFFFLLAWGIDFAFTTLAFSKRDLVFVMVFPLAGYYLAKRNILVASLLTAGVIAVYSFSQPMVAYARLSGVDDYTANSFSARAAVIAEYVTERPDVPQQAIYYGSQRWWTRFEFSAKQAFAMELHDLGQRSRSLESLPIVFIPRIVWPDKPLLRPPGKDFYYLVTGRQTNNMSITVYGDLFWQFGWLGVILITPILGMSIALMTNILLPEVRRQNFVYFPAALIGIQTVLLGPSKYLINGFLTSIPMFLIYLLIIRVLASQTRIGRSHRIRPLPNQV